MINTEFSTFKMDDSLTFFQQNKVSASLNLSDDEFDKVLSCSCQVTSPNCEVIGEEITYSGKVIFNVIYGSAGFERVESVAEFSYKKQVESPMLFATVKYSLSEVVLKKSNGMIYAETTLSANVFAKCEKEFSFLEGVDCLKKEDQILSFETAVNSLTITVSDEFECDKLKNVLYNKASAVVLSAECGSGVINARGEIFLSLGLLPFLPNSDIVNKRVTIPFNFEIDSSVASGDSVCFVTASIEKIAIKVYTQEGGEKSTVTCQIDLKLDAESQNCIEKTIVCDAFSNKYELDVTKCDKKSKRLKGELISTESFSGKFLCQIPENSRFICATSEGVEVVNCQKMLEGYKVDAIVYSDMIFCNGEGEYVCEKAEMPISFDIENTEIISQLNLTVSNFSCKLKNGQIDAEITVKLNAKVEEEYLTKFIENIVAVSEKAPYSANISVYIAQKGDDEWEVEKWFGASIDEIYALNPTLQFPLIGGEKIIYYRQ